MAMADMGIALNNQNFVNQPFKHAMYPPKGGLF